MTKCPSYDTINYINFRQVYEMMDLNNAVSVLLKGVDSAVTEAGFTLVRPENIEKDALPITVDKETEKTFIDYTGDNGKIRIQIDGVKLSLLFSEDDGEYKSVSENYFDPKDFDERDVKSLCNELNETILQKYGKNRTAGGKAKKIPVPVSKTAVKNGTSSYDGNTLANRLSALYPDLKPYYKENFEEYGEFLPDTFFTEHANSYIMNTIRLGIKQDMTKLFRILNDIYENGTNDTQSLVAVTILGEMNNDPVMLENANAYMCDDMRDTVILINKFLASGSSKKLREKLKNPPPYKPKKKKSGGIMSQLMGAGGQMPQQ